MDYKECRRHQLLESSGKEQLVNLDDKPDANGVTPGEWPLDQTEHPDDMKHHRQMERPKLLRRNQKPDQCAAILQKLIRPQNAGPWFLQLDQQYLLVSFVLAYCYLLNRRITNILRIGSCTTQVPRQPSGVTIVESTFSSTTVPSSPVIVAEPESICAISS